MPDKTGNLGSILGSCSEVAASRRGNFDGVNHSRFHATTRMLSASAKARQRKSRTAVRNLVMGCSCQQCLLASNHLGWTVSVKMFLIRCSLSAKCSSCKVMEEVCTSMRYFHLQMLRAV